MVTPLRHTLKNIAPKPLKDLALGLRQWLANPPPDEAVLTRYQVVADPNPRPRITLAIQYMKRGDDFGGSATGIDLFACLCIGLLAKMPVDVRVIVTNANKESDPSIFVKHARKAGLEIDEDCIELLEAKDAPLAVRRNEIFFTLIWWNVLNLEHVRRQQSELFGQSPRPIIYLCQDYDPMFYGFSSANMLARSALDHCSPLWCIINSSNLAGYLERMGHNLEKSFVFEPVISDSLRPFLDRVATSRREKRMLVYGRPQILRNCFPALIRGLRTWADAFPEFADWEVVSAGAQHDPIDLGDGRKVTSVGKLSLEDYAEMLLSSSVGISLMASPHPSYPPLEMSHFGLRTVTNSYLCKDLSSFHPNIISVDSIAEDVLADAIARACTLSAEPPSAQVNAEYVRTDRYPFIDEVAAMLIPEFA